MRRQQQKSYSFDLCSSIEVSLARYYKRAYDSKAKQSIPYKFHAHASYTWIIREFIPFVFKHLQAIPRAFFIANKFTALSLHSEGIEFSMFEPIYVFTGYLIIIIRLIFTSSLNFQTDFWMGRRNHCVYGADSFNSMDDGKIVVYIKIGAVISSIKRRRKCVRNIAVAIKSSVLTFIASKWTNTCRNLAKWSEFTTKKHRFTDSKY